MRHNRHFRAAVAALCAIIMLAGCSSLPTSGPVTKSDVRGSQIQPLSQEALGPVKGSSAERIVKDFIRACGAGVYDNFTVARQYLTHEAARNWKPEQQIDVATDEAGIMVTTDKDTAATITAPLRETISSIGAQASEGGNYQQTVSLARVNGELRISDLPDGIIMSRSAFVNAYSQRSVYFLSKDKQVTVPEPRWVPQQRNISTLVKYLAGGPSPTLSEVATTAFPSGNNIVERVDSIGTTTTVVLDKRFATLDPLTRSRVIWQLEQTISNAGGVTKIEYIVDNTPVLDKPPPTANYDVTSVMGVQGNSVVELADDDMRTISGTSQIPGNLEWPTRGALPGTPVVVVSDTAGLYLLPDDRTAENESVPVRLYGDKHLAPPAVDRCGWIWTSVTDRPGGLVVIDGNGGLAPIVDPQSAEKLIALDISLDGTRFVGLYEDDEGNQYIKGRLIKRNRCQPQAFTGEKHITMKVTNATDVTWVTQTSFSVFGDYTLQQDLSDGVSDDGTSDKKDVTTVKAIETIPVTGERAIVECRPDTATIFGGGKSGSLYSVTDRDVRYKLYGTQWRREGVGLKTPSFPG